jgi:molecular chaperone GrpE
MPNEQSTETDTTSRASVDPPEPAGAAEQAVPPELAQLRQERDDLYDRLLRKTAEFDNYRKRVEKERREQAEQSVVDLLLELLLVTDDFERALAARSEEEDSAYRKGVELIYSKLQDVLRKYGVRPIDALGADFDPNIHQAVQRETGGGYREGEVLEEFRRGYMLGDRLLRPAMVKVATGE